MSDAEIEQLLREVATGGPRERRRLLQALQRAGRPLGEAWPEGGLEISLDEAFRTDAVLDLLAQVDLPRLRAGLREAGAAFLADFGRRDLRAKLDEETVKLYDYEYEYPYDSGTPRWEKEGWRWRCDAPAFVRLVAASADGTRAAAAWGGDNTVRGGSLAALVAGEPEWRWVAPAAVVALGFAGGDALIVTKTHLYRHSGGEAPTEQELPLSARVVGFAGDAGPLFLSDGEAVVAVDVTTGAALWHRKDLRVGQNAIDALVPGKRALAVCTGDVRLRGLTDGSGLGTAKRGTYTRVWEDPESTMGLGRDRREYTAHNPSFRTAAWLGDRLVTVDADRAVHEWKVSSACRLVSRARKHDKTSLLSVATTDAGIGVVAEGKTLRAFGGRTWTATLLSPPRALGACGPNAFLVGLRNGDLRRVDARTGKHS